MSYSRTYRENIYYSGTVRCSYPPSENGGSTTVSYSGYVPVSVLLNVDTNPFDYSVGKCNTAVSRLGGSVVAMNSAQVLSINNAANDISSHVSNGFFTLIGSELSQNMAAVFSKFNSISELMADRAETLTKQQGVMELDYERTSTRYNEIFTDLDSELRRRVVELDKKAIDISEKIKTEQLNTSVAKSVATYVTGVSEDQVLNEQLVIANAKKRVNQVMGNLADHVVQEQVYAKSIVKMVSNSPAKNNVDMFVPVVFAETDNLDAEGRVGASYVTNDLSNSGIRAAVSNYFESNPSIWRPIDDGSKASIDKAFNSLAEQNLAGGDATSKRIYDMIMTLKNQNDMQSI